MKIYIHHPYKKSIFYILAHNTTNREYFIENNEGVVLCKYKNTDIEFVFKKEISFEENLQVKIKGRVIGYDDLLEQIKLDQCTIIE